MDAIVDAREQGGRIDDQLLTRLLRDRLHSKPCQNQGFVLDGYPKTIDQAKELFSGTTAYIYCIGYSTRRGVAHCSERYNLRTDARLTALCPDYPGEPVPER